MANDAEDDDEDGQGDHEEYEPYDLEFEEAEALVTLSYVHPENPELGEAIQLQLAANAAFTRTKGKGKPKGKDFKGKRKVARSQLSLDERRAKMKTLKATSKCLRCGGIGHWAGDPECKFSGKGKAQTTSKGKGGSSKSLRKEQVTRERRPAADDRGRGSDDPPAPLQGPPQGVPMDGAVVGGDRKFYLRKHRGKTY